MITNIRLATYSGTETVVQLLAEGLRARGHEPMLLSPTLGPQAHKMRERGFIVVDRVEQLPFRPDVIHAQHRPVALAALAAFPDAPAVFACHSSVYELEAPRRHAQVRHFIAVDELCKRRCISNGIGEGEVSVILNAVDLDRYQARGPLPAHAKKALLLTKTQGHHHAVHAACNRRGIELGEFGAATGRVSAELERELLDCDLVFATARMALEAAAVGCAVIVCDGRGFAGLLTAETVRAWRPFNLGVGILSGKTTEAALLSAIDAYDAVDAGRVCEFIRRDASHLVSTDQHLAVYERAIDAPAPAQIVVHAATAQWIEDLAPTGEERPWRTLANETFGIAAPPIGAVMSSIERRLSDKLETATGLVVQALALVPVGTTHAAKVASTLVHSNAQTPTRGFAICTTPRSGSNVIGQMLESTGKLGRPLEYFNAPARRSLGWPDYPDAADAQVRCLLESKTDNGVYAVKAFPWQLSKVYETPGAFESLPNLHFIRLKRRDKLAQAISWVRALQTGQYRSTQTPRREASYDAPGIRRIIGEIAKAEASWDIFFALRNLEPVVLDYDDALADPARTIGVVANIVSVDDAKLDLSALTLTRQADALSAEWRERFLGDEDRAVGIEVLSDDY